MLVGIVGKPSSGKSTFMNAACLTTYKTAEYPFTTIEPNPGVAYVRKECVCKELDVKDHPRNSLCVEGVRLIPINLLDVAGLVPDAWKGRGLGNKFLDDLRRADAFIHVVDASGSLDAEGKPVEQGSRNPVDDVKFLDREINMWLAGIIKRDWGRLARRVETEKTPFAETLADRLSGLSMTRIHILNAARKTQLNLDKPSKWSDDDLYRFVDMLRRIAKPTLIAANKMDRPTAEEGLKQLKDVEYPVVPTCSLAEYHLRKLAEEGIVKYRPGDRSFEMAAVDRLPEKDKTALERIRSNIFGKYEGTGVQQAIDKTVFELLELVVVYPVEDANKFCDHEQRVLPDSLLVPRGTTSRELAYKIHTDLGETFIHAIDAKTKQRLSENYELKDGDVIRIVSAKALK